MQVRMIPISARVVLHHERRRPGLAGGDDLMRTAVGGRRQVQAMPMDRRGFLQFVLHVHRDRLALVQDERRPPEIEFVIAVGVGRSFEEFLAVRAEREVERLAFEHGRNPQLLQRTVVRRTCLASAATGTTRAFALPFLALALGALARRRAIGTRGAIVRRILPRGRLSGQPASQRDG